MFVNLKIVSLLVKHKVQWDLHKLSCRSYGHNRITLKHDCGNLLIDRWMWDHWITGSFVHRQKSHMEVWQKQTFIDCRWGKCRSHVHAAFSNKLSILIQAAMGLTSTGQRCTSDSFHYPHYLMCLPYSLLWAGQQRLEASSRKHTSIFYLNF